MAKTIQQIQDMITDKADAREVINEITDYLQANPGGGLTPTLAQVLTQGNDADGGTIENLIDPTTDQQAATKKYVDDNAGGASYLVYTAYVNQPNSATNNIVPQLFQNTIGAVTWSRVSQGTYRLTSAGLFTVGKTFLSPGNSESGWSAGVAIVDYAGPLDGANFSSYQVSSSVIEFYVYLKATESASALEDIFTIMGGQGGIPLEIKVYP